MRGKFLFILTCGYLLHCSPLMAQSKLAHLPWEMYSHFNNWNEPVVEEALSDTVLTVLGRWPWGPCYAVNTLGNLVYMGNGRLYISWMFLILPPRKLWVNT